MKVYIEKWEVAVARQLPLQRPHWEGVPTRRAEVVRLHKVGSSTTLNTTGGMTTTTSITMAIISNAMAKVVTSLLHPELYFRMILPNLVSELYPLTTWIVRYANSSHLC